MDAALAWLRAHVLRLMVAYSVVVGATWTLPIVTTAVWGWQPTPGLLAGVLAAVVAAAWTLVERRPTDWRHTLLLSPDTPLLTVLINAMVGSALMYPVLLAVALFGMRALEATPDKPALGIAVPIVTALAWLPGAAALWARWRIKVAGRRDGMTP